ncbi:MAG: HAMP domain-containing sensor histidine kinase [Clostridia bacterium]|nr:HAMP domain-containing sensor histidine kinase [Clostridia bacterium]
MSTKIVKDFLRFNLFCMALLLFLYALCFLAARQYEFIHQTAKEVIAGIFGSFGENNPQECSLILVAAVYLVFFLLSCLGYSVSTLLNFNKTWLSLSAITTDDMQIKKFSKNFSDVEIALKDIKHDVFKTRQLAAQAESKKNDLVMYLAHDLKTPLTSVIGYLSLLDECPELPTAQKAKYTGIALEKAYRLEQLINEFFEITRFNLNEIRLQNNRIDLGLMLSQMTEEFYPMFKEKNLKCKIDVNEKIMMFADADKIARVFDNLLKNAVSYSYENSTIIIGARKRNGYVIVKFRNRCDEIPKENLDRLFEKFYRLDSSRMSSTGGSGLGLAISKQIVELHGGTLKAKSSTDHTDFIVILPFRDASITDIENEEDEIQNET